MNFISKLKELCSLRIWTIAYKQYNEKKPIYKLRDISGLKVLRKTLWYSLADPFIIKVDGANYLFYEKQSFFSMRGKIACVNLDSKIRDERIILKKQYHLSYPFIFKINNDYFMIPETCSNNRISLYKANNMPNDWEYVKDIAEISGVDTTIIICNEVSYLFTYEKNDLLIYKYNVMENIMQKKIKEVGVNKSMITRPAGNFFYDSGKLYRPSQDCVDSYGNAIIINEVCDINDMFYFEKEYYRIRPNQIKIDNFKVVGTHTYNRSVDYEVIDFRYEIRGLHVFLLNIVFRVTRRIYNALTFIMRTN